MNFFLFHKNNVFFNDPIDNKNWITLEFMEWVIIYDSQLVSHKYRCFVQTWPLGLDEPISKGKPD